MVDHYESSQYNISNNKSMTRVSYHGEETEFAYLWD